MKITESAVHQVYDLSKRVFAKQLSSNQAAGQAAGEGLMSLNSAKIYFSIFKYLMSGGTHKRAMNEYSTEYFLESIRNDFGHKQFVMALRSTASHITYYNSLKKGRRISIEKILERLCEKYRVTDELHSIYPDDVDEGLSVEGAARQVLVNSYERSAAARSACIQEYGFNCSVCAFNFEKAYGDIGIGFIHVHHLVDLATLTEEYVVDPVKDLRPVCPNCHSMLHTKQPAWSIDEIMKQLKK